VYGRCPKTDESAAKQVAGCGLSAYNVTNTLLEENDLFTLNFQSPDRRVRLVLFVLIISLVACQSAETLPTRAVEATVPPATASAEAIAQMPPTWTPEAISPTNTPLPPPPTSTAVPTSTPLPPTNTPVPLPTNTPRPTDTAVPTNTAVPPTVPPATVPPTALPTISSNPVLGGNILPNGSFEEGHYNQNGIPELQLPNGWSLEWDEGPTGFGSNSWDVYVRPETRVLSAQFLPASEHPLYIWDGAHTVKIFKGSGAISVRLMRDVTLEPGTYVFEINAFPDLVMGYENNQKIWANDPYSGEVRFIVTGGGTDWFLPAFGTRNTFTHTFTVTQTQTIRLGVGLRGRFALANNGYFIDAWTLKKVEG
jgi:hypothetical protein